MKNDGFTLLELIVTIGIMALIGLVIGTNMLGILSNEQDKKYIKFVERIENAACMYVEISYTAQERKDLKTANKVVTIYELIQQGYIDENLIDPDTNEKVTENPDNYAVIVKYVNNEKKCTMKGKASNER